MHKYFFFDRGILQPQGMRNLRTTVCQVQKDTETGPMFREDYFSQPSRKWEVRYDNSYPNVIFDSEAKCYRLYYTLIVKDAVSEATSLEQRATQDYHPLPGRIVGLAYAESSDGVHWEKPNLGLVEFEGSKENNLLMLYAHGTGVFLDEQELDPNRRYKLVTRMDYPGTRGNMAVSFSRDGIHWQTPIAWPKHNPQADSHNFVFRDPADNCFKLITRIWKNGLRISALCESSDFIHWSEPREILRGSGFHRQVYSMPVLCYEGLYLGLPSMYHEGDRESEDFDTVDCELAYATTYLQAFEYVDAGSSLIPRGQGKYPTGAFDCGCIYAAAPVEIDGRWCIYYMGGNGQHTNFRETSFARAFLEKDKFASLSPVHPDRESLVSTMGFHFYGETLELLLEGDLSQIQVALYNKWNGCAMPGYDFENCHFAPSADGYVRVCFDKPLLNLDIQNPCLMIRMKNCQLFAVRGDLITVSTRY